MASRSQFSKIREEARKQRKQLREKQSSFLRLDVIQPIKVNVERIAIIGDGPAAYTKAIELIQDGFDGTIDIVGPHLGEATRSGSLEDEVFKTTAKAIAPLEVTPSDNKHIKDIERQTFQHLKQLIKETKQDSTRKLQINLHHKVFAGFEPGKKIILKTPEHKKEEKADVTLATDMVFECTGSKRAVLHEFNKVVTTKKLEVTPFEIRTFMEPTFRTHGFLRTIISKSAYPSDKDTFSSINFMKSFKNPNNKATNELRYALAIIELQQLGWQHYKLPYCYSYSFPNKSDKDTLKVNLYTQVPDDLTTKQLQQFTQILFRLFQQTQTLESKLPDINLHSPTRKLKTPEFKAPEIFALHRKSKKYGPKKPVATVFREIPQYVSPHYFLGNSDYPIIVPLCDAGANVPFNLGRSLRDGLIRMIDTRAAFKIEGGKIVEINPGMIDRSYASNLLDIDKAIKKHYKQHQNPDLNSEEFNLLINAFKNAEEWDQIEKIYALLKKMPEELKLPFISSYIKYCKDKAELLLQQGNQFNQQKNYPQAKNYYALSLEIFLDLMKRQENKAEEVIKLAAASGFDKIRFLHKDEKIQPLINSIIELNIKALLKLAAQPAESKSNPEKKPAELLSQANKLVDCLPTQKHHEGLIVINLKKQIEAAQAKLGEKALLFPSLVSPRKAPPS